MNNIIQISTRIRNLMLVPEREWMRIARENSSRTAVCRNFLLPLLYLIVINAIAGALLFRINTIAHTLYTTVATCISIIAGLYLSAFIVVELMAGSTGSRNHSGSFALMTYSSGAACLVIAVTALFPFIKELLVLVLYSGYIYWRGMPHIIQSDSKTLKVYGLLSLITAALLFLFLYFLFKNISSYIFTG